MTLAKNLHPARWSASERWKCSFFDIASNLFHAWSDIMDGRLELTGRYAELMRPVDATSASSLTSISQQRFLALPAQLSSLLSSSCLGTPIANEGKAECTHCGTLVR